MRLTWTRELVRRFPVCIWYLALLAPGLIAISMAEDRMISPWAIAFATSLQLLAIRLLLPTRAFLLVTWPILVFGAATGFARIFCGVDLVELLLQLPTFTSVEISSSLRPYFAGMVLCITATGALLFACFATTDAKRQSRPRIVYGLLALTVFVTLTPMEVIGRAWPSGFLFASAALVDRSHRLRLNVFQDQAVGRSPRNLQSKWFARNKAEYGGNRQTIMFIIGESVRSDYLKECNGPQLIRPIHDGSLVACDVTAGADSTYHSVPLLISRELPGHQHRVSADTSFQMALAEVGFESYWLGSQAQLIGWSDALHQLYLEDMGDDALLPHLGYALTATFPRKTIVVHANNAHYPYCKRYKQKDAPYTVDCNLVSLAPGTDDLEAQKIAYRNAVDASVGFINQVIEQAAHIPGEVFLVFTSDHGENFSDDRRALMGHELIHPTRWDIQVPIVFWANDEWKKSHAKQWTNLRDQVGKPLTHGDIVPTLISAADVVYDDPRGNRVASLLDSKVAEGSRPVQISLGATTDWQTLLREAE